MESFLYPLYRAGGDNEFTNSLVMADYFFGGEFFLGAGIASMQLTNSLPGVLPAPRLLLQVGYTENLTSEPPKRFKIFNWYCYSDVNGWKLLIS